MIIKTNDELKGLFYLWFDTENSPLLDGWPLSERDENYYVNQVYDQLRSNEYEDEPLTQI